MGAIMPHSISIVVVFPSAIVMGVGHAQAGKEARPSVMQ